MRVLSTLWSKLKGVWQRPTKRETRPFEVGDIVVYIEPSIYQGFHGATIMPYSVHRIIGLYPIPLGVEEKDGFVKFIMISRYPLMPLHPSKFRHADELSELERLLVE